MMMKYILLRSSGILTLLLLWEIGPRLNWINRQFSPPLSEVFHALYMMSISGELFVHISVSLWRVLLGLLIAAAIGIPIGFLLGRYFLSIAKKIEPLLKILGHVNPFSLMPVFILFFGIGESAKLAIVAWVCLWPVLNFTITGVKTVDPILIKTAQSTGISHWGLVTKVLLPGALPGIFLGLKIAVEIAFFMLIAGEMLGASSGLGWLMHNSAANYFIARMYAGGASIVITGVLIKRLFLYLQHRVFFWKEGQSVFAADGPRKSANKIGPLQWGGLAVVFAAILVLGSWQVHRVNMAEREGGLNQHDHTDHSKHMDHTNHQNHSE